MPSPRHLLTLANRAFARIAYRAPLRLAFFALLALVAAWPLLSTASQLNEFRDAQVIGHYESAAARSIGHFAQAPLWDPYYCGGMYLLGTPQARFVSPTFLFTLLFGEPRGEALTAFAMLVLALEGAFQYARSRGALARAALLAAPVFGLSGVFAVSGFFGWTNFYGFALVPWIAVGVRRALRFDTRGAALAAVFVAWGVGFGGTYAIPLAALWSVLEVLEAMIGAAAPRTARAHGGPPWWRRVLGVAGMAALVASLSAGLAAVRLWPVAETMLDAPRFVGGQPGFAPPALLAMLFDFTKPDTENGTYYIGLLAIPAVLLGLGRLRSLALVAYGVLWAWLAPGYAVKGSLFPLVARLPVLGTLRYPERYLILLALVASALAAVGITRAAALARAKRWRRTGAVARTVAALALVAGVVPMWMQFHDSASRRDLAPPPVATERPFHQSRGNRWALAYYSPIQRGSLSCWDAYPVPESPLLRGDLETEEYLDDPGAGRLAERRWSPNAIDLDVALERPTRVVVNQNWHRGWRASAGVVRNERGLLEVDLPAGEHTLSLRFAPRSAVGGAFVSLVSLAAIGIVARRRRARLGAAVLAGWMPVLALAAALAVIPEARVEAAPLVTPTGEAIVRDELPQGAVRFDTELAGGITLVSSTVDDPMPRSGQTVHVELDWERAKTIEPGLGIFVHVEPDKGDTINGDHVDLSQSLSFERAPPGKILRDVVPITLPQDSSGTRWKIWVGLWRLHGGGERMAVRRSGSAIVEADRILAGVVEVQ